jgi:hypothetical protein
MIETTAEQKIVFGFSFSKKLCFRITFKAFLSSIPVNLLFFYEYSLGQLPQ